MWAFYIDLIIKFSYSIFTYFIILILNLKNSTDFIEKQLHAISPSTTIHDASPSFNSPSPSSFPLLSTPNKHQGFPHLTTLPSTQNQLKQYQPDEFTISLLFPTLSASPFSPQLLHTTPTNYLPETPHAPNLTRLPPFNRFLKYHIMDIKASVSFIFI